MKSPVIKTISTISWYLLILSLPFTSFPLVSKVFGGTSVAPLSIIFLMILTVIEFVPHLFRTRSLPSQVIVLLLFIVSALISSALGNFIYIPSYRSAPIMFNAIEGYVTLAVGVCFFIITILMNRDEKSIVTTIKFINFCGLAIVVYSLVQAISWRLTNQYPDVLYILQEIFTSNGRLYPGRVNAMAYEPSWLAHQFSLLYIPLWLSFASQRYSVYKQKIFNRFSYEFVFLILGFVVVILTLSRIGWLTVLALVAIILGQKVNRAYDNYNFKRNRTIQWYKRLTFWFGIFVLFTIFIGIIGYIFTRMDPRMAKLFDIYKYIGAGMSGLIGWASLLGIGERIAYWSIAYRVFLLRPLMGVGLGSTGNFFGSLIPEFAFRLPEVVKPYVTGSMPPNPKSLWFRILAETGIIGFTFFTAWVYQHFSYAKTLLQAKDNKLVSAMGTFGVLTIIALLFEGFSLDTFGLPYYWITLGLIAAVYRMRKERRQD